MEQCLRISVCDVFMRCMKCVLCLIDLCIISAQSHARVLGIKLLHQKQRMLEGDIKLFAGLFYDMHSVCYIYNALILMIWLWL